MKIKQFLPLLFIICFTFQCEAQTYLKGSVKDTTNDPLPYTNVIVGFENNHRIHSYTHSNDDGTYQIKMDTTGNFVLIFSILGYEKKSIPFQILAKDKEIINNAILQPGLIELNEIVVEVDRAIKVKKDTIVFDAASFKDGTEQVVEDLLKNIPGLNIDSDGTIKVGNKEVEKVMIEGDDFFEKGYKLLTKNMPSNPIDKIELLQNYSSNSLLKGIEESDKIALNLKLVEGAKSQWFGTVNAGIGASDKLRYEGTGNLMNFGKQNKYYFIASANNTGYDAVGELDRILKPLQLDNSGNLGDEQLVYNMIGLSSTQLNFENSRTNFNAAKLLSVNSIFNPLKNLKIRTTGFLNLDKNNFYQNSVDSYRANQTDFVNIEKHELERKKRIGFGRITAIYELSKNTILEWEGKYNNGNEKTQSDSEFNENNLTQNLTSDNRLVDQKINFGHKFSLRKTLLITGRYISEKAPQNFAINRFLYKNLFPEDSLANSVVQLSQNKMNFAALEAHLFNREKRGNLLELKLGNKFRVDNLNTSFLIQKDGVVLAEPLGYKNNIDLTLNDLYFKIKYFLELGKLSLIGNLDLHQIWQINGLEIDTIENNPFYINPSIGLKYQLTKRNLLSANYSFNTNNSKIIDSYNQFVLTGFRSFLKGTGKFNQLNASSFMINHQLGNSYDDFFMTTYLLFNKNYDFFSNEMLVNQETNQYHKIIVKDQIFVNFSSTANQYFRAIASNLKLRFGYSKSNYKNVINDLVAEVKTSNFEYGFQVRSAFRRKVNYHIGTKWIRNQIETSFKDSYINNLTFLNISIAVSDKFNIELKSERHYFGNLDKNSNVYYFLDLDAKYIVKENKLSFSLFGRNMLNNKKFQAFYLSDIGSSKREYSLLPAYLLVKMEYRLFN